MTLQSDFREVTDRIRDARRDLSIVEVQRLNARHDLAKRAEELEVARRVLMARADAGTNETARRAYADRETVRERERLAWAEAELTTRENQVVGATTTLRIAEDERRYLELVARLAIARVGDADGLDEPGNEAENGDGRYTLDAANRDLF